MFRPIALLFFLALAACAGPAPRAGDILVIGDSVMAWNAPRGASIPQVMAARLGREVTSRAVSGAQFANDSGLASAVGFDIRAQYPGGRWNWVVLDGGANDLGFGDCRCGACGAEVDRLIAPDGHSRAHLLRRIM